MDSRATGSWTETFGLRFDLEDSGLTGVIRFLKHGSAMKPTCFGWRGVRRTLNLAGLLALAQYAARLCA